MVRSREVDAILPDPQRVFNQAPPLRGYNLFTADHALVEAVRREGAGHASERLVGLGRQAGTDDAIALGFEANAHPPRLLTHDRFGNRIDEVEFHPSWHRLLEVAVGEGLHASPWRAPIPGAHVERAAAFYLFTQVEAGHGCPISMTYAIVPALRTQPELATEWEPALTSLTYDAGLRSHRVKRGVLAGMAMTERQGGSDVRSNTTRAAPVHGGGPGAEYRLTGHKWFCSAPMSDVFLLLAQAPEGLSCFLLPRVLEDGSRNRFHIQRLKDKLGNRSNASSEVEFVEACARMVGEPGRGVRTIVEMVNHTRLDCMIGSAAGMRQAVAQATHHAAHRRAFGRRLTEQPLMLNVLADLALESEAATALALRIARAFDEAPADPEQAAFRRLGTAVGKYWVCKRAPAVVGEALECLGGNGYVEESIMPRLYREAPLNSIWEGSGNVIALDALRAMVREPASLDAFFGELNRAIGDDRRFDAALRTLETELLDRDNLEGRARRLVEQMAVLLQASLLLRHAPPEIASAFCAARLGEDRARALGTLPPGADLEAIVDRARPAPVAG
ncbi:MAG TPA: isovaleryl-CoA dehydrogenase [Candidatus Limnocylindrales bacterium]|nr:isovaleryl-CoA dehydrogenase [Candidatus Limnocylindrales bacterium]